MGIFNDLKKVFFGAKSVTKSAAEKTVDAGMDVGGKLMDKTGAYVDQARNQVGNLGEDLSKTASDTIDKAKDLTEGVGEKVLEHANDLWTRTKETVEDVGGQVIEKSKEVVEQTKSAAESVGGKVMEKTEDIFPKTEPTASATTNVTEPDLAKDIIDSAFDGNPEATPITPPTTEPGPSIADSAADAASKLAGSVAAASEGLAEQAQVAVGKGKDVLDGLLDKAGDMADQLKEKVGEDDYVEEVKMGYEETKGSLMDGHDDFFEKAAKYADGDYHNQGTVDTQMGDVTIKQNPDYEKPEATGTVKGFDDLDGDGDELIDDAIILDE